MKNSPRLCSILIMLCIAPTVFAGSFYVSPELLVQDISASSSSYRAVYPELALGYGHQYDKLYLAGELFGTPGGITIANDINNDGGMTAKATYSIGAAFIPGVLLDEKLLCFFRFGLVMTKFIGPSNNRTGAQFGMGLQTGLAPHWDLRAEYIYTAYQTMGGLGAPKANALGLGVIYRFDG